MENQVKLDATTSVTTKITKRQASELVSSLTKALADNPGYLIDLHITLRNEDDKGVAIISVDKQGWPFEIDAMIVKVKVSEYEEAK